MIKRCPRCTETKPYEQFYKGKYSNDGCSVWCKLCTNEHGRKTRLAANYGLTLEQFEVHLSNQDGRCAICQNPLEVGANATNPLAPNVDHIEGPTGPIVRGILCRCCNVGLGNFKDDPKLLRAAASYLEMHCERRA